MSFRTATASRSASTAEITRRGRRFATGLLAVALTVASIAPARAALHLESFRGHLAVGYGKLLTAHAPGGSISFSGGVEYPVRPRWTAGVEVGYWLLGTRLVERGSLGAELDYSTFEALALARWHAPSKPVEVAFGPGVTHARADLTSSGAAGFGDLAVEQTRGSVALSVTAITQRPGPVRVGVELAGRLVWLPDETWSLIAARLAIHY
jgi:hypothetical protein